MPISLRQCAPHVAIEDRPAHWRLPSPQAGRGLARVRPEECPSACRAAAPARTHAVVECPDVAAPRTSPSECSTSAASRCASSFLGHSSTTRVTVCRSGSNRSESGRGLPLGCPSEAGFGWERPSERYAVSAVIVLLDDVRKHETISVARDRANKPWLARVVAQRPADRANGLTQRTVGDDDVVPHAVEDVAPVYGFMPPLDEKHEQIEITGDERLLEPLADQGAATRREDEIAEAITRHGLTMLFRLRRAVKTR